MTGARPVALPAGAAAVAGGGRAGRPPGSPVALAATAAVAVLGTGTAHFTWGHRRGARP